MECKGIVKRFLGRGTAFCLIASSILNPADFKVRAEAIIEDITNKANITKTDEGTVKLEKATDEDGEVSYRITATPDAGQKLKKITVNGTEVPGTVAAGGHIHLKVVDILKLHRRCILERTRLLIQTEAK